MIVILKNSHIFYLIGSYGLQRPPIKNKENLLISGSDFEKKYSIFHS